MCEIREPTSPTLGTDSILLASEASPHPKRMTEGVHYVRAKRAPILSTWPDHPQGVLLEPRTINEEMILDPDLGGTDDLKSYLRDL